MWLQKLHETRCKGSEKYFGLDWNPNLHQSANLYNKIVQNLLYRSAISPTGGCPCLNSSHFFPRWSIRKANATRMSTSGLAGKSHCWDRPPWVASRVLSCRSKPLQSQRLTYLRHMKRGVKTCIHRFLAKPKACVRTKTKNI